MKITKRQLRRIIKEEKARLLNEYQTPADNAKTTAYMIHEALQEILDDALAGSSVEELEMLSTMQVTGPGGWDEATQALARIALSQLSDGGHHRGS